MIDPFTHRPHRGVEMGGLVHSYRSPMPHLTLCGELLVGFTMTEAPLSCFQCLAAWDTWAALAAEYIR